MSDDNLPPEEVIDKEANRIIGFILIWFSIISSLFINFVDTTKGALALFAFLLFIAILGITISVTNTLKAIDLSSQHTKMFFQK